MASHLAQVALLKKVSLHSDDYYEDAKPLGEIARDAFGRQNKAQMSNLENIANSATRVADILDFIKRQTGRSKPGSRWLKQNFGRQLLEYLDGRLRKQAAELVSEVAAALKDSQFQTGDKQHVHILLCREFIRHLMAHYLYSLNLADRNSEEANG